MQKFYRKSVDVVDKKVQDVGVCYGQGELLIIESIPTSVSPTRMFKLYNMMLSVSMPYLLWAI